MSCASPRSLGFGPLGLKAGVVEFGGINPVAPDAHGAAKAALYGCLVRTPFGEVVGGSPHNEHCGKCLLTLYGHTG